MQNNLNKDLGRILKLTWRRWNLRLVSLKSVWKRYKPEVPVPVIIKNFFPIAKKDRYLRYYV